MKNHKRTILKYAHDDPAVPDRQSSAVAQHFDRFSSTAPGSAYVVDILQKQFCEVRQDDLFLCGHSVEYMIRKGFGFYSEVVYDISLWANMYEAVLQYLKDFEGERDEIDYFSCTFRLQRSSSPARLLQQMVHHRMKPVWENNELRHFICAVWSSTAKKPGNLRMYNKDGLTYEEYNLTTRCWKRKKQEPLTERERAILMLAGQGKNTREIAHDLCKGHNTIRNQVKKLYSKLNVHSMQGAIEYARYHQLLYPKQSLTEPQPEAPHNKRSRVLVTKDMLQRIQQHLDEGISIRQAARLEGIAESAIRYWKGKGKLKTG
jgi:DNA-binding CsgD family transcriptional regulator